MTDELRHRFISGFTLAAVFLTGTFLGGWAFAGMVGIASLVVWFEWFEMNLPSGDNRAQIVGLVAIVLTTIALVFVGQGPTRLYLFLILSIGCGLFLYLTPSIKSAVICMAGFVYAFGFLVSMVMLRGSNDLSEGLIAVLYLCIVVWMTDIGAYFAGRYFGGPKLAPKISPNKTISGAVGGMVAACGCALLFLFLSGSDNLLMHGLLALILSAVSQGGDLFESFLKRKAGVKDSGKLIPGHGGVMDCVDGLVFASIFLWVVSSLAGSWNLSALTFFNSKTILLSGVSSQWI